MIRTSIAILAGVSAAILSGHAYVDQRIDDVRRAVSAANTAAASAARAATVANQTAVDRSQVVCRMIREDRAQSGTSSDVLLALLEASIKGSSAAAENEAATDPVQSTIDHNMAIEWKRLADQVRKLQIPECG